MTQKLIVALTLLLGASSAALAAPYSHHHWRYGYGRPAPYGPPRVFNHYNGWRSDFGGTMPNDTRRSFDYQQDMGSGSGKPGY